MNVSSPDQELTAVTDATGLTTTIEVDQDSATICQIVEGKVKALALGVCTLIAKQPGNSNFNPAPDFRRSFNINNLPAAATRPAIVNKNVATLKGDATQELLNPTFCLKTSPFTDLEDCTAAGGSPQGALGTLTGYNFNLQNPPPSTTYYYYLFGSIDNSRFRGSAVSFKTLPSVVTDRGTSVTARAANLNARVSEPLDTGTASFCYQATQFTTLAECISSATKTIVGAGNPTQALVISNFATFSRAVRDFVVYSEEGTNSTPSDAVTEVTYAVPVSGLSPNTTYYFIIYGTVDGAEYDGGVQNFTTPAEDGGGGGFTPPPPPPPPVITSLSNNLLCAVSNDITIFGNNFDGVTANLDGVAVTIKSATANSLVVTLPAGSIGMKTLTVLNSYGSSIASINYLTASKPRFQPIRIPYLSQGVAINLDILADHALSFRLVGRLPSGVMFTNSSGLISGTPTENGVYVFDLIAVGPCGETMTVLELDIDAPTPNAMSHRINFLPGSCQMTDSARASFEAFITRIKGLSPRNIIPDIYISGGSRNSDPNSPLAQCRQNALCDLLLIEDLLGEILTDVFTGAENRIEIIVYWPRPNDDL
jgi:hypothetical protein